MPTQQFDSHERQATQYHPGMPGRPATIVTGYLVTASAWILLSGAAVDRLVGHDYRQYAAFEQAKGLAFVAVTGLILRFLLRRYTNTIERFRSLVKRSIGGVYHSVSAKHLQSHLNECAWRYNERRTGRGMFYSLLLRSVGS